MAVLTAADLPNIPSEEAFVGEGPINFRDVSRDVMARGKALYEGHAVAAVAATTPAIASQALDLIEVEYEVLHEDLFAAGIDPKPSKPRTSRRL